MKLSLFLFLSLSPLAGFFPFTKNPGAATVSKTENAWSKEELTKANTAGGKTYLTPEERDIVLYTNLVRMNGEKFFNTFFQDFVEKHNRDMQQYSNYNTLKISRSDKYYTSLEKDLRKIKDLPVLWPDEALSWVARQHAKDMNKRNYAAHNSPEGKTPKDRISQMYPRRSMGENLSFGFATGLGNVCMLLLDKNVPDLGHRKMILDTSYGVNFVGVSIQPHKSYRYCAVMDFVSLPR
ncbi:CAP domain-containing protein [Pedobacter sp. JY14-1]|uniref:CAP domain-containing protein n=1 Tax=Pedobacter sp. JY14-1 TaxID=3034151 RepID=UPI0023E23C79|nr:CAP domain-containing protein [Pedobacter sp. JY14-1]